MLLCRGVSGIDGVLYFVRPQTAPLLSDDSAFLRTSVLDLTSTNRPQPFDGGRNDFRNKNVR